MTEQHTKTHTERTPTEARAGVTGHNVRYVLVASLIGAIVVCGGVWGFVGGRDGGRRRATADARAAGRCSGLARNCRRNSPTWLAVADGGRCRPARLQRLRQCDRA